MNKTLKNLIPEEKQSTVIHALQQSFGTSEWEELHPTSGGQSSALVFRIRVKGKSYLLKIMRVEIISNPEHEFACMKTAAEAGIAPRVWYANAEERVLITDYVDAQPYPDDLLPLVAPLLHKLHSLPGFSKPAIGSYFDTMDGFVRRFQATKLLPENAAEELFRYYSELLKVYPRNESDLVACHNDLKPQNMVFDGTRLWLIDWESAFLNDPYTDLAIVANFFVKDEADEEKYLKLYFGEAFNAYHRARFFLMRQALHMFYGSFLMALAAKTGIAIEPDLKTTLNFREFHQRLISNEIDTLKPAEQVQYAKIHLSEALQNMRLPKFKNALTIVNDVHAKQQN